MIKLLLLLILTQKPQPLHLQCEIQETQLLCDVGSAFMPAPEGELPTGWYDDEYQPFTVTMKREWRQMLEGRAGFVELEVRGEELCLSGVCQNWKIPV